MKDWSRGAKGRTKVKDAIDQNVNTKNVGSGQYTKTAEKKRTRKSRFFSKQLREGAQEGGPDGKAKLANYRMRPRLAPTSLAKLAPISSFSDNP